MEFPETAGFQGHDDTLEAIIAFGQKVQQLDKDIETLDEQLKSLKAQKNQIVQEQLPDLFQAKGLSSFELSDGTKISLKPFYSASLPESTYFQALDWLEENGHGAIIKNQVQAQLDKGDIELASQAVEALRELGILAEAKRSVHPSTLKAWVKEMFSQQADFPKELFKAYEGQIVQFK